MYMDLLSCADGAQKYGSVSLDMKYSKESARGGIEVLRKHLRNKVIFKGIQDLVEIGYAIRSERYGKNQKQTR